MIRKSLDRNTFQKNNYLESMLNKGKTVDNDDEVKETIKMFESLQALEEEKEKNYEWQKNNLEYDLRTNDYIAEKCKDNVYAQHLYAALCNNEFIKNQVWNVLQDKRWSCSWRYAGGIVAHIKQEGDYINWYCSGIKYDYSQEELDTMTEDNRIRCKELMASVGEGTVTDEVRNDLLKLGWIVADSE